MSIRRVLKVRCGGGEQAAKSGEAGAGESPLPSEDKARYHTSSPARDCPKCKKKVTPVMDNTGFHADHGYMFLCPACGAKLGYGGKIKRVTDENGKRKIATNWPVSRLGMECCQFCGRTAASVAAFGSTLEVHHLVPIVEGGLDTPGNLLVLCPWCHKEAHSRREFVKKENCEKLFAKLYELSRKKPG